MLNLAHAFDDFIESVLHVQQEVVPALGQGGHQPCRAKGALSCRAGVGSEGSPPPVASAAHARSVLFPLSGDLRGRVGAPAGALTNHAVDGAKEHGALRGRGRLAEVLHDQGAVAEDVDELAQVEEPDLLEVLPLLVGGGRAERQRDKLTARSPCASQAPPPAAQGWAREAA